MSEPLTFSGRVERAHYRFLRALWVTERRDLDGAVLVSSEHLSDPEWNHALLTDLQSTIGDGRRAEVERFFRRRRRRPTFALRVADDETPRERQLADLGWRPSFEHRWVITEAGVEAEPRSDPEIEEVGSVAAMEEFAEVFGAVFGGGEDYRLALIDAFSRRGGGLAVHHVLLRRGGAPAAIATLVHDRDLGGCYNLGVLPEHRRRGLGTQLNRWRIGRAVAAGCGAVFLQTEEPWVDAWHRRSAFRPMLTLRGWTAPTD